MLLVEAARSLEAPYRPKAWKCHGWRFECGFKFAAGLRQVWGHGRSENLQQRVNHMNENYFIQASWRALMMDHFPFTRSSRIAIGLVLERPGHVASDIINLRLGPRPGL